MIDYFALFQLGRRPWLEAEELKEIFHERARAAFPDAELNEAYQTLRDPKRRLQHLLKLSGAETRSAEIPSAINELFPTMASLTHAVDSVLEQMEQAGSALSRSLLRAQLLDVQNLLRETLRRLQELRAEALVRLKSVATEDTAALQNLHAEFSYLDRWITELQERELKLFI